MRALPLTLLVTSLLSGCSPYEYQEDVILRVDGSGEMRIKGSEHMFAAVYGIEKPVTTDDLEQLFDSAQLRVVSSDTTTGRHCRFLHIRGRFEDINDLTQHRAFRGRRYLLERTDDLVHLETEITRDPRRLDLDQPCGNGREAFRFHFPGKVRQHTPPTGVERGNIIRWERSTADALTAEPLHFEVRFERRSVLATTLILLATALGLVCIVIGAALYILIRIGRRQIAEETEADHEID